MKAQYILRPLLPILQDDELWSSFMDYAKTIRADGVMAFNLLFESNHPDLEELRGRLPLFASRFAEVREAGMSPMINYFITLGHQERLRTKNAERFAALVDGHGQVSTGRPCPLCPEFRHYITEAYAIFASLDIDAIWIDDDFRLISRTRTIQCFCDRHLQAFAERTGVAHSRQAIMDTLMKEPLACTDEELALRRGWRTFQEDVLVGLAGAIRDACAAANPRIAMGLMTNNLSSVLLNGRHLDAEIRALRTAAQPEPWIRVGGATYTDEHVTGILHAGIQFDAMASMIGERCRISSEIEHYPWNVGGKSARALALELYLLTLTVGPRLTLSINDGFLGFDDVSGSYRNMLPALKPYLQAAAEATEGKKRRGASLPLPSDPLPTAGMDLKNGISTSWNQALARIGIPLSGKDPAPVLITLQEAVAYSEETLLARMSGGAIVTSEAWYRLQERSMLRQCPIRVEKVPEGQPYLWPVERVTAPHAPDWLRGKGLAWIVPLHKQYRIAAGDGAEAWSALYDNLGSRLSDGVVVAREPYPLAVVPHTGESLKETGRQWLYQQLIARLSGGEAPAMAERGVNLYPIWWEGQTESILALTNFSLETYPALPLWIPTKRTLSGVERLGPDEVWGPADWTAEDHPDGGIRLTLRGASAPEGVSFATYRLTWLQ